MSEDESTSLTLSGHLFDTKSIHKILDILYESHSEFGVTNWTLGHGS